MNGLVLEHCASVHTCFMRFAIDVVFMDSGGRVLRVVPSLKPWRFAACPGARFAWELPAGESLRLTIRRGTVVRVVTTGAQPAVALHSLAVLLLTALVLSACGTARVNESALRDLAEADADYDKGELATARSRYLKLTAAVPEDAHAFFRLGNIAAKSGDLDAATNYYREALLRDARHARAMHNLARVEIERARALLTAASSASQDKEIRLQSAALARALEILLDEKRSGDLKSVQRAQ
jgi:tetratricopeptide (TPR) repeat protein